MAFDRDADAVKNAPDDKRFIMVHNNFRFLGNYVRYYGFSGVDGILADLGVSSHQFDTGERGFSFRFDSALDMRMNQSAKHTAADILNSYSIEELTRIFQNYGEVENSSKVARAIAKARELSAITTTQELRDAIEHLLPKFSDHKYLAKIYQALRIEVNGEMRALEIFLRDCVKVLNPGGILSVITYHSLEDRMVKNFMKSGNLSGKMVQDIYGNRECPFEIITRKPILPSEEEISANTRARSAKLRVAKKI